MTAELVGGGKSGKSCREVTSGGGVLHEAGCSVTEVKQQLSETAFGWVTVFGFNSCDAGESGFEPGEAGSSGGGGFRGVWIADTDELLCNVTLGVGSCGFMYGVLGAHFRRSRFLFTLLATLIALFSFSGGSNLSVEDRSSFALVAIVDSDLRNE